MNLKTITETTFTSYGTIMQNLDIISRKRKDLERYYHKIGYWTHQIETTFQPNSTGILLTIIFAKEQNEKTIKP